ncbi:MAG: ABC transporter ATP-binding protein [Rhodospirillales bacterium]|nr:ABC transporter ATP-binding protein [Rhodospirillales bacterium]
MTAAEPVLQVDGLRVRFASDAGAVAAVNGISFALDRGETLALVGESGSGKSVTSLAVMRLLPPPPVCEVGGRISLAEAEGGVRDLLALPEEAMCRVRGDRVSMIFQEPMTSLNPVLPVGEQIAEAIRFHRAASRRVALAAATDLLERVGIPEPRKRLGSYAHHLSGGQRQRVMIAMALACNPEVLIADEPTTALDVTVQAQILELLRRLQQETGMAVIFITHNLGVVAEIADRVLVMYAGRAVEEAEVATLFRRPLMPYTAGLLASVPRLPEAGCKGREGVRFAAIPGTVPDPLALPSGCSFHPRCVHAKPGLCDSEVPDLEDAGPGHRVRCRRWRAIDGS